MRRALAFLTPLGGARTPAPSALAWFPIVGAIIGLALGGAWWGSERIWPKALAAAVVVVADLAITGMLHFDGLLDSADGLLAHMTRERRLAVMSEPTVGAFGMATGIGVLLLRWAALAAIAPNPVLLGAIWACSRTAMAVTSAVIFYARSSGGLATAFLDGAGSRRNALVAAIVGTALTAVGLEWWNPVHGLIVIGCEVLGFVGVVWVAKRRLGGFTGDVLGAAGMVGETLALLAAAGRW